MSKQTVKQALTALMGVGLTQTAIASELQCTQPNIHYHIYSDAKNPRHSTDFADRLKKMMGKYRCKLAAQRRRCRRNGE